MRIPGMFKKSAPLLVTFLMKTLRFKKSGLTVIPRTAVYVFWHGKMLGGWWALKHFGPAALVSQSKDGEILAELLEKWGYNLFRGSSSSGGKAALAGISEYVKNGGTAVITPDGPRGPAKYFKNGALILSHDNSVPVIPVCVEYSSSKILERSWDRFEVPYPFAVCRIKFGDPVYYSEMLYGDDLDEFKHRLSAEMSSK